MLPDRRNENKSEIILDYLYVTFASTFMGLKEMLKKKTNLDEVGKIDEAIQDLLEVLQRREITEITVTGKRLAKRTKEMIDHLMSISKMSLPQLRSKNVINNEKNHILQSKTLLHKSFLELKENHTKRIRGGAAGIGGNGAAFRGASNIDQSNLAVTAFVENFNRELGQGVYT
jgi:hypothetical protein